MEAIEIFDEFMEFIQVTDEEKAAVSRIIMVSPSVKESNFIEQLKKTKSTMDTRNDRSFSLRVKATGNRAGRFCTSRGSF